MLEEDKGHEWIERVKSEGAVPLHKPGLRSGSWCSPRGDIFWVRGANYLRTKSKVPSGDYLLKPLGFDWLKGPTKISEVLNNRKNRVRRALDNECAKGRKPFVWAFNFQLPSKDNCSIVSYFVALEPSKEDSLINRFLKGDYEFKKSRLKLIANVVDGPWIVKKAIGEQAISVIGKAITCNYCMGENFIEVDMDVGSSMLATAITHLAFGYLMTLTVDIAFLIEGQTESELPERILGAFRFSNIDHALASEVESPHEGTENLQSSLPTRLWKTVGQGISHLIHPGAQDYGGKTSPSYANRAVDRDTSRDANKP